jgi:hypothetical protein
VNNLPENIEGDIHIVHNGKFLFGLGPRSTIYIQYTPPKVPQEYEGFEDDPLAKIVRSLCGPGDEKYERITFQWKETIADEPILERYYAYGEPYWKPILPGDAANLLGELARR